MRARGLSILAVALAWSHASGAALLVHTNDVLGELEPCGCRSNPLGGVAREANLLKRQADPSQLRLDAGDLLFQTENLPDVLKPQAELQAGYLVRALNLMHEDAVVPGEKDFALGVRVFGRLRKKADFVFLAANLKLKKGGHFLDADAVFALRKKTGGKLRVGVIGVVGKDLAWPAELEATDPIAAVKARAAALRQRVDRLVVLSHAGYDTDREIARRVPGIDFIVGGHTQSFLQTPVREGKTWVFQSSFRNQYVGLIPLDEKFDPDAYRLVGLDAGYDSPIGKPSKMDALVAEFKKAVGDLNSKLDAKEDDVLAPDAVKSGVKYQTFPRCAECHLKQFDFWRATAHAGALHALINEHQEKNKECLSCHTVGLGDPMGYAGVNHLAELRAPEGESASDQAAPRPLDAAQLDTYLEAIHHAHGLKDTVKVPLSSEERALPQSLNALARSWAPVQCENCHQPGRDHPFSGTYSKAVDRAVCLTCHTPARAPDWYTKPHEPDWALIAKKRALIQCPAD